MITFSFQKNSYYSIKWLFMALFFYKLNLSDIVYPQFKPFFEDFSRNFRFFKHLWIFFFLNLVHHSLLKETFKMYLTWKVKWVKETNFRSFFLVLKRVLLSKFFELWPYLPFQIDFPYSFSNILKVGQLRKSLFKNRAIYEIESSYSRNWI